jgi:hypothetical protein
MGAHRVPTGTPVKEEKEEARKRRTYWNSF